MKINDVFSKKWRHSKNGIDIAGGIDAALSANVSESGSDNRSSTRQRSRIEQRGGNTVGYEDRADLETAPISPNLAAPIDAAVAFNVSSDDSTADARSEQEVDRDERS